MSFFLVLISNLGYYLYAIPKYDYWTNIGNGIIRNDGFNTSFGIFKKVNFIYLPIFLIFFVLVQAVKRIHDTDKSGWFVLVVFYNFFLVFTKGTVGKNRYGLDPITRRPVKYFDELNLNKE